MQELIVSGSAHLYKSPLKVLDFTSLSLQIKPHSLAESSLVFGFLIFTWVKMKQVVTLFLLQSYLAVSEEIKTNERKISKGQIYVEGGRKKCLFFFFKFSAFFFVFVILFFIFCAFMQFLFSH